MRSKNYSSQAIILSRKNYSEADRLITLFTKNYGKLRVLAKGVRRIKSKKRGSLEVFTKIKFNAGFHNNFFILSETEIVYLYEKIRRNLMRTALAYYFLEVIEKISKEQEENTILFEILDTFLLRLEYETKLKILKEEFIYEVLTKSGYWPSGKKIINHDIILSEIVERRINSLFIGKKMFN